MQNWQQNGQADSAQSHNNIWSGSYAFPDGSNQFDATQNWQHQIPNQSAFPQLAPRGGNANENNLYASPHQGHAVVANDHNGMSTLNHGNFHNGQFALDNSYTDAGQEDPLASLGEFPQDLYGRPGKADFTANIDGLNHGHTPEFSQQQFQYNGQANQLFNGNVSQYAEAQLMPQHGHQSQAQLQQRFDSVPQSFSPAPQGYVQSPQQHQAQPERVFSQSPHPFQAQPPRQQNNSQGFSTQTPPPPFQQSQAPQYQQDKFVPQQMSYAQPVARPPFQAVAARQMPGQDSAARQSPQPQHQPAHQAKSVPSPARQVQPQQPQPQPQLQQHNHQQHTLQPSQPLLIAAAPVSQPGTPIIDPALQPEPVSLKKRKRVVKKEPEPEQADSPGDATVKKGEDGETLVLPSSTEEEMALQAQFKKRNAASKKQFPPIPGASFLVTSGTTKLIPPKSYDRLAPLVALSSPNGRRILPELRPDLPCEIQGRFMENYRPSPNFVGKPDDREAEARPLIEQYQREMTSLGLRRPKYADYPFAFQEQLKADEAAKSKAQRKARKEEEEERKKPIRPEKRPADPIEGAVWDILGIVYIDPSATRTNALIAGAVQSLGEFFIKLRSEAVRLKQEADHAAKDNKPEKEIAEWNKKLDVKKETFTRVCEAAAKHGDEAVLENFGSHQKGILSLVNMLIGAIKAGDLSGPLPKALLRFMSNISMFKKVTEAVNFENVRKRLAEKGDAEVKDLVRTIASRIKKDTEPVNAVEIKKTSSAAPISKVLKPAAKPADGSPAKRVRDEESDSRVTKKLAVESTSSVLGNKLGAKPVAGTLQSKFGAGAKRPAQTSTLASKIRAPKPVTTRDPPKVEPSKFEGPNTTTPMDVDKKPAASAVKPESRVSAVKTAVSSGSSLSSIASLLDSITAPKQDGPSTQAKDSSKKDISETPEQKAKRLRKEARRHLRVSFKPPEELVEIRIFTKEVAEGEDNMTKDAADDRSEGMMLKQRNYNEDDDEDDELPEKPWARPTLVDLSGIPEDIRNKSYVTRGGNLTLHTEEQKFIEEREKKELMVTYMDVSDIPPTPKSPAPEFATVMSDSEGKVYQLPQGEPKYDEIHKRWKETQTFGWEAAQYYARKRLDAKDDPGAKLNSILGNLKPIAPAVEPEPYNMTPPKENAQPVIPPAAEMQLVPALPFDDKVHSILTSDEVKTWQDANPFNSAAPQTHRRYDYPDPAVQAAADQVEEAAETLRGLPYPATSPPAYLANNQERTREWWAGYQKDSTARAKKDAEDAARNAPQNEAQTQQPAAPETQEQQWAAYYQQQQQYAQYMAMLQGGQPQQPALPAPTPAPATQPAQLGDSQLQAMLAQMGQQQPGSQGNAYGLNPSDTGYQQLMMLAQLQQQPQQQQAPPPPAVPQSPPDHETSSYKPPHLQRQLVDYSDRDTRDEFEQHGGRERDRDRGRDREREGKGGKQGKNRKGNAPGGATLAPHRPVNRALIGTKPCSFWQQGKCARGEKCTFRHDN
ncbi:hypothetical protein CORC01_06834 [Colletotrichum orchidophilum]|uniref:C3H1-type domain-containing protein n=1 Tax=Colletotrichum orchidophilum TaxID=1209926 RepID=A0A1G4B992_9PEZI|nr:uncharacterized protein CORC01_06834 [Colletotrichum orchidophilum]OHE97971.1 hypothetical protein CORC01_06834 [Colletotrichum orchidophilum]